MYPWPFLFLTLSTETCGEHRHNTFGHVCTVHHTKIFDGVGNKPAAGLGREGVTGALFGAAWCWTLFLHPLLCSDLNIFWKEDICFKTVTITILDQKQPKGGGS